MSPWYHSRILMMLKSLFDPNRETRQNALLWVLTISIEHKRPLGKMIESLALDEGNSLWSAQLHNLAKLLDDGIPLPDALEQIPGLLPPNVVLAIRVGTETGTLPEMLKDTAADFSRNQAEGDFSWRDVLCYLIAVVLALFVVASFLMYWVIPKFKKIFEDFGTELPPLTEAIIKISDEVFVWIPAVLLIGICILLWMKWRTRHGTSTSLWKRILFSHSRSQASLVLRILSVLVEKGRPVPGAISTMARHHDNLTVRNHLLYVRNEVERGRELWEALAEMGMITPAESRILSAAHRAGNLPWALKELAESIERDLSYRSQLMLEVLRPACLLSVSISVGIFAIAMFLPLLKLIHDLS